MRVAGPKRDEDTESNRAKYDSFLDNPTMSKSPNQNSRQALNKGPRAGTYNGALSKSQERFTPSANSK